MVFNYKRKSTRGQGWTEESMARALMAVETKKLSIRKAAMQFGIPYPTLQKHVVKKSSSKTLGSFKPVFSKLMEEELVKHIQELDSRFYGLTKQDLCTLAYEFATRNNLPHNFQNGSAGEQWYKNFLKRHPELSLRQPESTSIARATGFNRPQVQLFFDNLKSVREKHKIYFDNTYNVDETGIQTSAKRPPKVISSRGKKQVGAVSSAERGQLVTAICCCLASGKFVPPCLIFPRKKRNPRYLNGTPPGTIDFVTDNGWVNCEVFLEWLKFFVRSVRPSEDQKCLLILDNHISHRSLELLDYASQNHVIILSVPPHCTHKLQPLDVAVYGPLSTYFERAVDKWQKQHPSQHITLYELGEIFGTAYLQAATPQNAINGFKKSGIYDGDIDVFSDVDFAPSSVTDKEISENTQTQINQKDSNLENDNNNNNNTLNERMHLTPPSSPVPSCSHNANICEPVPSCSYIDKTSELDLEKSDGCDPPNTDESFVSVKDILQLPKVTQKKSVRKRKSQKSEILTSTPVKEALRIQKTSKKVKLTKNSKIKELKNPNLRFPTAPIESTDPTEEDVPCIICGDTYGHSKSGELWVQCNMCQNWAHQLCSDYTSGVYICDCCKTSVLSSRK